MRAILTAPVARTSLPQAVKIPDATNGVVQAWDTNAAEFYQALADPAITIYTGPDARSRIPTGIRPYMIQVLRSDSALQAVNPRYVRFADLQSVAYVLNLGIDPGTGLPITQAVPGDFFRVQSALGAISVKLRSQLLAGDVPVDWVSVHDWLGVADTLGAE